MSTYYHNAFMAMATRCHVVFPGIEEDKGSLVFHQIKKEVLDIEERLSIFKSRSEAAMINSMANTKPLPLSIELYELLKNCKKFHKITGGGFDITLRPLGNYWKEREGNEISNKKVTEYLSYTGMENVILDDKEKTVFLKKKELQIDFGGIGKGYALEKIHYMLQKYSIKHAFISFGESSVLTAGSHPAGNCWKIGIKNFFKPEESIHTFMVRYGSVSTSSNFYVKDNGELSHHKHIIDPRKGHPVEEMISVSVCSGSPLIAEMLSTAILVSPDEAVPSILKAVDKETKAIKIRYHSDKPEIITFNSM